MSGTFSSLSTALSALRHQRVAMDVAGGNVANAGTPGYARRQVVGQATGAPAVPAIWSRWEMGSGDGVQSSPIARMVDPLLDSRARGEHAAGGFLDVRAASLLRFESSLGEPGDHGVAAALTAFQQGWHDVANNPADGAARTQVIARAETLRAALVTQDGAVRTEWADQRTRLEALGAEVNQIAGQLARLNDSLRNAQVAGTDAGVLLDQRDQLTMRLAELTGSTVTVHEDTTVEVRVGGQPLVTGNRAAALTVTGARELSGAGADPVTLAVDGVAVTLGAGTVGGTQALLNDDLPGYVTRLDTVVAELVATVNAQHGSGVDRAGAPGSALFGGSTAADLTVLLTHPDQIAAGDPARGPLDGSNATTLGTLDAGARSYRELVTRFGVEVATAQQGATRQSVLVAQVDASREAVSGISVDEEMVNLLAAQRAYEGAARVLSTLDSVLDTLINRTGAR